MHIKKILPKFFKKNRTRMLGKQRAVTESPLVQKPLKEIENSIFDIIRFD